MELNAPDREFAVTDSHDLIILGCCRDFQTVGYRLTFDDQRVVSGGRKFLGHILKKVFFVVIDAGCLAMHQFIGSDDFSAKGLSDRLVA